VNTAHTISDLSKATPSEALSQRPQAGHWQVGDYICEGMKGKLLYAGPNTNPPELKLPLNLQGWHQVTVGLWGASNGIVKLKLTGDPCFMKRQRQWLPNRSVEGDMGNEDVTIEEVFLTCADLTGKDLFIAPPPPDTGRSIRLAYVRCEPLSSQQVQEIEADRRRSDCRKVMAYNDGVSFFGRGRFRSKEDFWELIEPYRHSDVETLVWGLTGDITTFPVEHGKMAATEYVQALHERGINPLATALEYAHSIGLQFYIYQRMGAWADPFPNDGWTSDFYSAHPEWRCVDPEGIPVPRLSYAYPEVRRYCIDLLAEVAAYGVDGVDLNFLRGTPYVLYEEPLVSGFRKEFGEDPRELDEWDERWLRYRSRPITELLRELRQELDNVGGKLGKRIALSPLVFPTAQHNLFYGLDLETWVKEGLVDRLVPWGTVRGMPAVDLKYYRELTEGTTVTFWPHLPVTGDGWGWPPMEYRKEAVKYYDAGAEGLAIWDLNFFDSFSVLGPLFRRLGHIEEMRAAIEQPDKPEERVIRKIDKLGEIDLRVWSVPATHREKLYPNWYPRHLVIWPS